MKRTLYIFLFGWLFVSACQKETISFGTHVSDVFYLDNHGASMHILVGGNTVSRTFILIVHGGPGASASLYRTDYIRQHLENQYALVYWDQRDAGASQGNSNAAELTLEQMTDDLKKVILLLKSRYGQDISVFLLGHSFGGLLTSSYLTAGDNQEAVKGWIFVDGSQDYPLNDTLTLQKLLNTGEQQIALNVHTSDWKPIVNYCLDHLNPITLSESIQLEKYAAEAETYFDFILQPDVSDYLNIAIQDKWPLTSLLFNYLYSVNAPINKQLEVTRFTPVLYRIKIPTLILFGEYDFVCPKELGEDLYKLISSQQKKIVISPISGHDLMLEDPALFCREVSDFVEKNR